VPMLIADTSPLVAMLNAKDKHHRRAPRCSGGFRSPVIAPTPIITEVAYFLRIEPSPVVEAAFLDAWARGELVVEATTVQASPGWPTWCGSTLTLQSGPPGPLRGLRAAEGPPQVHARARGTAAVLAAQKGPALPVLPATPGHWPPARRPRKNMAANTRLRLSLQHKPVPSGFAMPYGLDPFPDWSRP
jgi:hypothetical protein